MGRVENKVVVVTGAGRGQGRSHAVRLAEEGADIIAIDICQDIPVVDYPMATPEDLAETARLVEKTGRRVFVSQTDVRDRNAMQQAIDAGVAELGRLDAVVANAGISPVGANRPATAFGDTVDTNLNGALHTAHAALPYLGEGGSIVLIGSAAGLLSSYGAGPMGPGGAGYVFAKQAIALYANWLAPQLAPKGIRVNVIHPANVDTPMIHNPAMYRIFRPDLTNATREEVAPSFQDFHAMPIPYLDPIEISHAVTYLVSDESRFVTGLQLKVDAGAVVNAGR
ncbi:mycofactocin-coupled SDR family oxidoreductase [Catellatospora tritici]|uniref:mycofactocin-coupled SDR family oxidoreductase n=1 Tax=Catellatospora tritici TaxID=2851566 RepID=UPI001C2CC8E6|nr:mycofactocin-coupled SDR family oxidoreductase [Catellatospora tritici]MBV1855117.1 mycofactocin-coupled SDR family oxidoreductase [Catellatospora tritici]